MTLAMSETGGVCESTRQLLARLGFVPNHEAPEFPSWRATREGRSLAAVNFDPSSQTPTLTLVTGGDNPIDAHLIADARGGAFRLQLSTGPQRPRPTHTTGDADFDARFEVFSYANASDVLSVMLDDAVRRDLLALPTRVMPSLRGETVTVNVPLGDPAEEAALIEEVLPTLWSLGLALDDASRRLPLPERLRPFFDAFERAAKEHEMTLRHNALSAKKTSGGAGVSVIWRSAKSDLGNVSVDLAPGGIELHVVRESGDLPGRPKMREANSARTHLLRLIKGDPGTGDGAFDRRWIFEADDPDAVRAWLSPDVRTALIALRAVGLSVEVFTAGVIAKGPLPSSDAVVPALLPQLEVLARSMVDASTPFRGP